MHDPALFNLGYTYHQLKDYEQAIKSYSLAAEVNPSAECHYNLATAFKDSLDDTNALKHFKLAYKYDQNNLVALINIGLIYEKT